MAKASGKATVDKSWQNSTTGLDPLTQQWREDLMGATRGAAAAGPGASVTGATNFFNNTTDAGNLGVRAMSGDSAALSQLMNPYQSQVMDSIGKQWEGINATTARDVADTATMKGAFGGNRAAVAGAVARAENDKTQAAQKAGLLSEGFNTAMGQAGGLANMGMGSAQLGANLGMMGADNPQLWQMLMLRGGMMGTPYGTTSSGSRTNVGAEASYRAGV